MGPEIAVVALIGYLLYRRSQSSKSSGSAAPPSPQPQPTPSPQPSPQPEPSPSPQPSPEPYPPPPKPDPYPPPAPDPEPDPAVQRVNQALAVIANGHPDFVGPYQLVDAERDASGGRARGMDIYGDTMGPIGFVVVASATDESSVWGYRAPTIPQVKQKLTFYANILEAELD